MNISSSVEIDASPAIVWDVFADAERWPEWTTSVTRVVALDGPGIEVGKRFRIELPRLPKVVWTVTEVEPGVSWTWRHHSPGATTLASHRLTPLGDGRTLVEQRIEQHGPVGVAVGKLIGRLTERYLELEGQGLKARSEQRRSTDLGSPG